MSLKISGSSFPSQRCGSDERSPAVCLMDLALRSRLLSKAARFCRAFGFMSAWPERVDVIHDQPRFGRMEEDGIEKDFPGAVSNA